MLEHFTTWKTSDNGETWELRNQGLPTAADMNWIYFVDSTTGFMGSF